ncbi:hypothetical protein DVH24_017972 [Malus domestica]|uniref:Uncharacterized protein n=1 Tax=Malus domestica TaxID=3750 RepID=A0A498KC63_MALDO|nr:hypothetical protein DVH24_017972 [Malus domestica]
MHGGTRTVTEVIEEMHGGARTEVIEERHGSDRRATEKSVIEMHEVVFEECYLWQGQISNDKLNLQSWDKVDIAFEMPDSCYATIKRTGVNLVWDKPMKENMHDVDLDGRFLIQRHNQGGDASSSSHA